MAFTLAKTENIHGLFVKTDHVLPRWQKNNKELSYRWCSLTKTSLISSTCGSGSQHGQQQQHLELDRNVNSEVPHQIYWVRNGGGEAPNLCWSVFIQILFMVFAICNCKECHDKHFCSFMFYLRTDYFFRIGNYQIKDCSVEL